MDWKAHRRVVVGTKGLDTAVERDLSWILSCAIHEVSEVDMLKRQGGWFSAPYSHDYGLACEIHHLQDTGVAVGIWENRKNNIDPGRPLSRSYDRNTTALQDLVNAYRNGSPISRTIFVNTRGASGIVDVPPLPSEP